MYLDRKFGLNLSLSEITLLFDLSLYLDRTWAQRKAQRKAKSKVKVAPVYCNTFLKISIDIGNIIMNIGSSFLVIPIVNTFVQF